MSEFDPALREIRPFPPTPEFQRQSRLRDETVERRMHAESLRAPDAFWGRVARELPWQKPWDQVLHVPDPNDRFGAQWFVGAQLNASSVCLDQHLESLRGGRRALVFEDETGDVRSYTYTELHVEVCRFANALKSLGVRKGERVALYLPHIPEAVIAMLACARVGAIHCVIPPGAAPHAVRARVLETGATLVVTADGGRRHGVLLEQKRDVDRALEGCDAVLNVVVVRQAQNVVPWRPGRDVWFHELVSDASDVCAPEPMDAEDPLFVLYATDATGSSIGVVHRTGGYLVGAYLSAQYVFDLHDEDVFWCTAELGSIAGHTYGVYGALSNGTTVVLSEGAYEESEARRVWEVVERHGVSTFVTDATELESFRRAGDDASGRRDLSSLRLLGSIGESLRPETWLWFRNVIGGARCPIVDAWGRTETGSIVLAPLPGLTATKPGACMRPFFGIDASVVDDQGREVSTDQTGHLVLARPWPTMLRGRWGTPQGRSESSGTLSMLRAGGVRFGRDAPGGGSFATGTLARRDGDGDFWIVARPTR